MREKKAKQYTPANERKPAKTSAAKHRALPRRSPRSNPLAVALWARGPSRQRDISAIRRASWTAGRASSSEATNLALLEEIRALYDEKVQSSPSAREAVLRAVNKLLEADECAIDAIAAMTQEYVRDNWRPDDFYRGVLALLATVSSAEYETLRALLRDLEKSCAGRGSHAHLWAPLRFDDRLHIAPGSIEHATDDADGRVASHEFRGASARRVVRPYVSPVCRSAASASTLVGRGVTWSSTSSSARARLRSAASIASLANQVGFRFLGSSGVLDPHARECRHLGSSGYSIG